MILRWLIFISIYTLIDIYAFQAIKTLTRNPWVAIGYILASIIVLGVLIYQLSFSGSARLMMGGKMYIFGFFLTLLAPKLLLIVFMFGEDIFRVIAGLFSKLGIVDNGTGLHIPSRRKFISTIALGAAAIPFVSLLYGMSHGKYNYKVLKYALEFDDLPEAFDGFTITQISDIHSGSFTNAEKVKYAVDLVNEQKSDVVLFTGDLVNNVVEEMDQWKSVFSTIEAKEGVFSVLGNHDYGDYVKWESAEAKETNLNSLKQLQGEMGWNLLLNEHHFIERNNERLAIVGVENWGENGFKKAGDLDAACNGVSNEDFKILMSHDPSHWKAQVKNDNRHFQLTLSGHTHGMQFGIEIPGWIKWSPVKYQYTHWAGIYEEFGRFINVNRGFGYLGYPGRVGIWPEITVIQLKVKPKTA
jgi:predicted MPP superfamily phosphohydrolase